MLLGILCVPKILSREEMLNRNEKCQDALELFIEGSNFIEFIITGDETLVNAYDPETKRQSLEWHSPVSLDTKTDCESTGVTSAPVLPKPAACRRGPA
ncbi:hypothetical protein LAZ67_7002647 [Cordylochernes scorpioides]|uniref:Uncharacterized protein n=1 Tax=Cordylochernes scorpioides TaxID=51811 RepID=A0ABY6KQ98_9ARAC|nr:hypothetical protein LAZ67_7002647 [Cordylochernes scorpioides]